ncbi:hypothetical protein EDB92DRAFT_1819449 [Lactarius akahatsu]|uniref:NACHT domain-containing protein n=1 Tax=Lactarius akahatsu TaxID=416441 RepID=A0AAD4LCV5_9AGAM|nr:hypothetical protein EDB92DRAFT_1819449 [Lactarius akahatsu]
MTRQQRAERKSPPRGFFVVQSKVGSPQPHTLQQAGRTARRTILTPRTKVALPECDKCDDEDSSRAKLLRPPRGRSVTSDITRANRLTSCRLPVQRVVLIMFSGRSGLSTDAHGGRNVMARTQGSLWRCDVMQYGYRNAILDALDKYAEQTGINLNESPFADKIKGCESPNAILLLLQDNLEAFNNYRDQNRKFVDCLSPVIQFVHAFSGILGETAGLVTFQPAKLIFVSINVLVSAADGVSASYDALLELFECLGNFLKRLHIYAGISLDPSIMDIIAKIMVELISILALAKKIINRGRLTILLGDSEIETILKRLDRLTQEEARMTTAQTLAVVHGLLNNMKVVMDGGEASTSTIRQTLVALQEVANEINKMKRDRLQRDARKWISPPDPSKNHIIARRIHYGKSAVWCTRGPTFKNWDLTGGLLWIHGIPGSGKSILCSSIIEEAKALRKAGLGLVAYYYFDFIDTAKQDVRGLLSSLIAQLSAKSDLCYDILSDLYSEHDAGSQLPDDDALTQCLKDMLELPDHWQPSIYIIVDALDECPNSSGAPSPRELVLDLIEDLVESHVRIQNVYGKTPYQDALKNGYREIARLLSEYVTGGV